MRRGIIYRYASLKGFTKIALGHHRDDDQLSLENPKVPSNILNALGNIKPSQLMDTHLWDFKHLEKDQIITQLEENAAIY